MSARALVALEHQQRGARSVIAGRRKQVLEVVVSGAVMGLLALDLSIPPACGDAGDR